MYKTGKQSLKPFLNVFVILQIAFQNDGPIYISMGRTLGAQLTIPLQVLIKMVSFMFAILIKQSVKIVAKSTFPCLLECLNMVS